MTQYIVNPPPQFNINEPRVEERFVKYKNDYLTFLKANGYDSKDDGQKIAIFTSHCGEDLRSLIEADATEGDTFNDVLQRLQDHYEPATNQLQQRFNFLIRRQRPNENFDKYLIELKKIIKTCDFGALEESMLKVVLIMNLKDTVEQRKFLIDADSAKLEKLIPDFRRFDAQRNLKSAINNQPQKQNNAQVQKQNNTQPQKQNNNLASNPPKQKAQPPNPPKQNMQPPNPPTQNNPPNPAKQNTQIPNLPKKNNQPPKPPKQNNEPNKQEVKNDGNDNAESKKENGVPDPKKKKNKKKSQAPQNEPANALNPPNNATSQLLPSVFDALKDRINKLTEN